MAYYMDLAIQSGGVSSIAGSRNSQNEGYWSQWMVCVPIINIMFSVSASEPRDNQYGPPPLPPK